MLPQPPNLIEHVGEWRSREVFWMLKHGIKMSGMPAFGGTHSDETIWTMVAFAKQLPTMSAATYAAIPTEGEGHHHGDKSEAAGPEPHHSNGEPGHHH